MKDYILKPGTFIAKSTVDKTADIPGLSLEKYIVSVLNGETCCIKNIVADSLIIGEPTPVSSSAIVQINSTTQGFLFPRMTTAQRNAIVSPAVGLIIYNTTDLVLNQWNGTQWTEVGGGGLSLLNDALMTTTLTQVVDKDNTPSILSISTGSVGIGTTTSTGLLNLFKPSAAVRLMINGDAGQNRLITYRTGGVQRIGLYLNNTAETGSNVGSDFAIRRYTDTGTLGGTPLFIKRSTGNVGINTLTPATTLDVNGTANIAERLTIEADSTATTQSTAVIQNTTTNSGIALVPNGTGAITADIPDGTTAGGNARAINAVDLQSSRTNANQVASGNFSIIAGGINNRASGITSAVSGGQSNTASGTSAVVVGGDSNTSSGSRSLAGGIHCVAGGNESFAIGQSNTASGGQSVSLGWDNISSASFSFSQGRNAIAYLQGQSTIASGSFDLSKGVAQASLLIARQEASLTTAATTILSLDGTGTTNLIIPTGNNRMWNVKVSTIAVVYGITGTATGVSVGDSFMENRNLLFKRVGGTSSIVGVGTAEIIADTSMLTALMTYTAGASQELVLTFNGATFAGGGSVTMRIVSKVELVEVAYA